MLNSSTDIICIHKVNTVDSVVEDDVLAVEEPLEISLSYIVEGSRVKKNISITMRTPGNDVDLAIGFLFTEGIIKNYSDVVTVQTSENAVCIDLSETVVVDLKKLERNFYTTSSCGVCGKTSIDAIKTVCDTQTIDNFFQIKKELILELPSKIKSHQSVFESTGGIHASALFNKSGKLLLISEDVGRHNALDKLIGKTFKDSISFENKILLLSGRASFELIQKAAMAGITIVCAVGAPSSLAVTLAKEFGITLIGFLRDNRFNIYTNDKRILV